MRITRTAAAIALAMVLGGPIFAQDGERFHIQRTITLGGDGSWDYLRFDPEGHRLFIARQTRVMVVDLAAGKLTSEIADTAGVHGVALVGDVHLGVTSNGKANTATIFDFDSLKPVATVATGEKPDGILFEPFTHTVLTMNAQSNSISMIDVRSQTVSATIALPGRPETPASDAKGSVFVNLEDKAQIAVVDMKAHTVLRAWDLPGCTEPTGLAIDTAHARLFSGCHNGVLMVVDANSGKLVAKLPIGLGVDAVAYDPELHLVFTSNKEGSISIIDQAGADSYTNRETVTTLQGAKTMALDPVHHLVYTVANRDGQFVLLEIGR